MLQRLARIRPFALEIPSVLAAAVTPAAARSAFAGNVELGAAWQRKAKETGREYLSVKLDDPSFPTPIYASLIEAEGTYNLIWSR